MDTRETKSASRLIFVFGSNLSGIHGKGAALHAKNYFGAEYGVGVGRTGNAYAIPTKNEYIKSLPLKYIESYIKNFIKYAVAHPELNFRVTRVGCGLAGYRDEQIAPMFRHYPPNCIMPDSWLPILRNINE
jgi:hypothetical protein